MFGRLERQPFPLAVGILAITVLFVSALSLLSNAAYPRQMDFISFWAAGKMVLSGTPAAIYDIEAHKAVQLTVGQFEHRMPFPYPPPFLFLVTPFALIPFGPSAILWFVLTLSFFLFATTRVSPSAGRLALAFPPVLVNGIVGQNGLLTGGIFFLGLNMLQKYPLRAGLMLGCLVVKPQLAVLLPLALVAGGHWRTFVGAVVSVLVLLTAALLAFGPSAYSAMFDLLPLYGTIAADGLVGWHKMASIYASMRLAGVGEAAAWTIHALIGTGGAWAVWAAWRSKADMGAKSAVLACASMLVSPYLYMYDTALLLLPFLWLLHDGENRRLLALLWCIPLVAVLQNWGFNELVNPAPLLPIALLAVIGRRLQLGSRPAGMAESSGVVATAA